MAFIQITPGNGCRPVARALGSARKSACILTQPKAEIKGVSAAVQLDRLKTAGIQDRIGWFVSSFTFKPHFLTLLG